MKYLALNTAKTSEILLKINDKDFYFLLEDKVMTSTVLLKQIQSMLAEANANLNELDFFSVILGPGSFTGLRIGVNTIKAFCYSLNKPVLPLTYFDYLSYNKKPPYSLVIDGMGGVSYIKNNQDQPLCIKNEDILRISQGNPIISDFPLSLNEEIFYPSKQGFKEAIEKAYNQDKLITFDKISPLYLRKSQPEREKGEI